uniref:Anthranilate synthase component 2 n=1 Tax=Liagora brachyclada TaxID=1884665 RepID=A0A1G4NZX9_9FLOR|nr:Anthranilate synthase component II [Liagora brachyclada]SCW24109.1 Anthranilate synthase component II [Liagora brachyclada]
MIVIIDNYDSFTYNLEQSIGELGFTTKVYRNDSITAEQIEHLSPSAVIISPGPGDPCTSGVSLDIITNLYNKFPILGVCLGHQAIALMFGGLIIHAPLPIHGKTSWVYHDNKGLFSALPNPLCVTRYHSLVIDPYVLPHNLEITAWTDDGVIMACRHKEYPKVQGIQFHPESLWTVHGQQMLKNFLEQLS